MGFNGTSIDRTDWHILSELQQDARLSYSELGRRVGLTAPAVTERVRRLREAGVIVGFKAVVNLEKLGYLLTAFIRVRSKSAYYNRQFVADVEQFPEILECYEVTGEDCYFLKVALTSVSDLDNLIDRLKVYADQITTSIVLSQPISQRNVNISTNQ